MKGLVLKDFYVLRRGLRVTGPLLLLLLMVFDSSFTMAYVVTFCSMLPWSAMAYDEQARWDRMALMLPVSSRDIVVAKYMVGWLSLLAISCIGGLSALLRGDRGGLTMLLLWLAAGLLFLSLLMPVAFRYGPERGRVAVILMFAIFGGMGSLLFGVVEGFLVVDRITTEMVLLAAGMSAFVNLLTVPLSVRWYERRVR